MFFNIPNMLVIRSTLVGCFWAKRILCLSVEKTIIWWHWQSNPGWQVSNLVLGFQLSPLLRKTKLRCFSAVVVLLLLSKLRARWQGGKTQKVPSGKLALSALLLLISHALILQSVFTDKHFVQQIIGWICSLMPGNFNDFFSRVIKLVWFIRVEPYQCEIIL